MKDVKVSVVVPVYNMEEHLEKCLQTLLNQTLPELEIIIVDDGSDDRSPLIIEQFSRDFPSRIRAFRKSNGGVSDARNFGLSHCDSEYVGFVDPDDYVMPDMFARLYSEARRKDADIAVCPVTYMYSRREKRCYFSPELCAGASVVDSPGVLLAAESYACNKIFRTTFLNAHSFHFPTGQYFEDSAVIYNIMLDANRIAAVEAPLYSYRREQHGSITATMDARVFDVFVSCRGILEHFRAHQSYASLQPFVSSLCTKHVMARIRMLWASEDRVLALAFAREALDFLNREVEEWRKTEYFDKPGQSPVDAVLNRLMVTTFGIRLFLSLPVGARTASRNLLRKVRRKSGEVRRRLKKALNLQPKPPMTQHMLREIADIGVGLDNRGVANFLDFGTLLGVIREGRLLPRDADIDMAVLGPDAHSTVSEVMAAHHFKVWRQYFFRGRIVEESYRKGISKIDMAYYECGSDFSSTWLFYRKPGTTYENNERNVVEMRYKPIGPLVPLDLGSLSVNVPERAAEFLQEKYGVNWRTPDPKWIYWKSPAAITCTELGHYRLVEHEVRTPWAPTTTEQALNA